VVKGNATLRAMFIKAARVDPNATRRGERLMGKHCAAKLQRALAKRDKAGKRKYAP